jgi:hypothetical protein
MLDSARSERYLKHISILYASHAVVFTVVISLGEKLGSLPKVQPPRNIDFYNHAGRASARVYQKPVKAEDLDKKYKQ